MNLDTYRHEAPPRREILDSGAVLLTQPVAGAHSLALGVWLRAGSQAEPPGLGGLAHFLEHMVFKGTTSRSAFELAQLFDSLGVAVDAFTTKDEVAFTIKVLPEYLRPSVELLADMLLRPAFDPELVALEQDVVCEEIQEAHDTPEDRLHDAFAARLFVRHPRGRPILGTEESVRVFTADLLRREHARLFAGDNLIVAIAGHLAEEARQLVLEQFAPAALPVAVSPGATADAPGSGTAEASGSSGSAADNLRLELRSSIIQSYFEIGNLAVSYRHPDRIPLALAANILGGGMSSRLFQAVRERLGLAYTIYTYSDMGRDVGLVSCAGSCSPGKTSRLEEVVRGEYRQLIEAGLS
jgi:predicted Zn-dependent peptidase